MKQQQAVEYFLAGRRVVLAKFVAHHYKEVSNKAKKVVGIVNLYEVQCADGKAPTVQMWCLLDRLDAARTPHLNGGCLPVGALNFVKVHDADDLFGLVADFLVVMRYKLGENHAAACQEAFHCLCLFHVFPFGLLRDRDATTFAAGTTGDLSVDFSNPAGRAGGIWAGVAVAAGWTPK